MLRVGSRQQCLRPISSNSILLNFLLVREIIYCSIHSPFPLFMRHLLITCHIPGTATNIRYSLINSSWSQSSKKPKATKKACVKACVMLQVHCNIIWKALGTKCHGSPEEIINNFPAYVRKAYFIWMFKNEKELLSWKNGGKQSRQRELYVSQSFRTIQGHGMFIEQGDLHWTGWGLKGMVRVKPGEVGWGHRQSDARD